MIRLVRLSLIVNLFFLMSCGQSESVRLNLDDMNIPTEDGKPFKMLVYYDSIGCFDCKMKEFLSWGTMLNYFENSHQECPIFFLLSPKAADSARIFNSLSVLSEYGNITLDHDYAFARNNPILHDSKYRGLNYVVDSNNFVRLSGRFLRDRKDFKKCESFLLRYVK